MTTDDLLSRDLKSLSPQTTPPHVAYESIMRRVAARRVRRRAMAGGGVLALVAAFIGAVAFLGRTPLVRTTDITTPSAGQSSATATQAPGPAAPPALDGYAIASGNIGSRHWSVAVANFEGYNDRTCLVADDDVFERSAICFARPGADQLATWTEVDAVKPGVAATGVFGVVPPQLASGGVTSALVIMDDGQSMEAPVVAAPMSEDWAYFAAVSPGEDLAVRSVQLFSDGEALSPPQNSPAVNELPCRDSAGNTMPCPIPESQASTTKRQ